MKTLKITNGYPQMSDPKLDTKSHQILAAMTGNPNFTAPVPSLAVLAALIAALFQEICTGLNFSL